MRRLLCEVFKSSRKDDMYLYVDKAKALSRVPETLLEHFGRPVPAMTLLLTPDKKLARADAGRIMDAIDEQGFYLQLPPVKEAYLLDLYRTPTEARY